jgi:hypothetical protein
VTRRLALLLPFVLRAESREAVLELVTPLAAALANGDSDEFLRHIPEDSPHRSELSGNVRGLMAQAEVTSSVEFIRAADGRAELDWLMDIRGRANQSVVERRREKVIVSIRNGRIYSIEPAAFFRPVTAQ